MNVDCISVNARRVDLDRNADVSTVSSNLLQHIQRYVNDATLLRSQRQELIFTLPLASAHKFAGNLLQLVHILLLSFLLLVRYIPIVVKRSI